jgi:GNAT superfamily N-acetyltransferase
MAGRERGGRVITRCRSEPPEWRFGALSMRRYRPADHAAVLRLHHVALAQVGLRPGDGVYYDHDFPSMETIYLTNGGEFVVGVLAGGPEPGYGTRDEPADAADAEAAGRWPGRLVTMGGLRRVDDDTAEMVRLRVHPDVQRRGYGAAMVLALEERARELGYRSLRGDTTDRQRAAISLYRRFGWRETRRKVICGIVNIYLEKSLSP